MSDLIVPATMTVAQVEAGLRNIGYDTECGACMALFYTGSTLPGEEHTCATGPSGPTVDFTYTNEDNNVNTGLEVLKQMRRTTTLEDLAIAQQARPREGIGNVAEEAARFAVARQPGGTLATRGGEAIASCIRARSAVGVEKYGTVLQAHNGRSHMVDAFQELLDAAQYLTGEVAEARMEHRGSFYVADIRHHVYEALSLLTYALTDVLVDVNASNEGQDNEG